MQEFINEKSEIKNHSMSVNNRESLEMTGIRDVSSFNEEEVNALCDCGSILIKGSHLLVETLDTENGILKVNGRITAVVYSEKNVSKKLFGKVFS